MPILTFKTSSGITITVDDTKKLGKAGGEGSVYLVQSPSKYKDFCVKIYHNHILSNVQDIKRRQAKIEYLVRHPIVSHNPDVRICAPYELVFSNQQFVGFVMPKAFDDNAPLTALVFDYNLSTSRHFQKLIAFDGSSGLKAVYNRLVIANNIAYAISMLHATKHYVLVDTKPENILITPEGKVSLIDVDSVQIVDNQGALIFPASAWTENYRPPEGKRMASGQDMILPSWDSFSFGVLAYEIIIGCHPYSGTYQPPYDKGVDTVYCIDNGLFLNGKKGSYLANPAGLNKFFDRYNSLPKTLRVMFARAFDDGHYNASKRPVMTEWGQALSMAIQGVHQEVQKNHGVGLGRSAGGGGIAAATATTVSRPPTQPKRSIGWILFWACFFFTLLLPIVVAILGYFG